MQPFSGNQRPDLLYNMFESRVSCTAPATRNAIADPGQTPRTCHRCWNCCKARSFGSLLARCISIAPATRNEASTSVVFFFTILTSKCASCHNCVHFFNISTSKSALRLKRFVHFYFETCFVPQRLGLFQRLTSQKCSEAEVFLKGVHIFDISTSKIEPVMVLTFSVPNVLRPATACAFSTSQLPQVLRGWGVFDILTSKHASRHNGVQLFLISHLPRWLCTCRFSESTFRPSGATKHWKNKVSRLFYCTFLRTFIFFLLALSLLWPLLSFFSLAAELSILSEFDF